MFIIAYILKGIYKGKLCLCIQGLCLGGKTYEIRITLDLTTTEIT